MDPQDVGRRLQALRESQRPVRSRTVVSQLAGLHPDAVRRYERGEQMPAADALVALAEYYGVTVDYILRGDECEKK